MEGVLCKAGKRSCGDTNALQSVWVRVAGGRERQPGTEAQAAQSCFLSRRLCNRVLPPGANCPGQEETLEGLRPSFRLAGGRRNELKTKSEAG